VRVLLDEMLDRRLKRLGEELVTFEKDHPDLPWAGEQDPSEER
jgi:hypothetical protein